MEPSYLELDLLKLSRALAQLYESKSFWKYLEGYGPSDGGCVEVALAIKKYFRCKLWGIYSEESRLIQHMCVSLFQGCYADAYGVFYTGSGYLIHWNLVLKHSSRVYLAPVRLDEIPDISELELSDEVFNRAHKIAEHLKDIYKGLE